VEVDPGQFEQVIMNLVVNARDAMPDGGVLIISTENRELRTSLKRSNYTIPAGRYVTISVRDTGHGIPEEIRGQIFEPFFTTKTVGQGTGLGLSTVYGIVKQSGGFIEIDNTAAMGVEFTVLLPASTPAVRSEPPVQQHARPARERKTLLLVEDEIAVRTMLTRILERAGFTVLSADGPAAALKLIEQQSRPVDLLLTDVVLREMGGPALAQSLQQRLPELKVVFMSGYTDEAIARQGVIHQGASLLEKPFTSDQLLETLKQALG
jgi:two-component system cell cycle sensor histidine kinase/response regulator CckA